MFNVDCKPGVARMSQAFPAASVGTSSLKTYRNDEQGFELKYPEKWTTIANSGSQVTIISIGSSSYATLGRKLAHRNYWGWIG